MLKWLTKMNAIEIQQLVKQFGSVTALDHVDLIVPTGSIFGFLGPNGAGKTTLLRILAGLARPTSGTATIAGIQVGSGKRPPISYLPDTPSFYNWMRARDFLVYIARLHGILNPAIDTTLEQVGLRKSAHRKIGGFSRGMKQRLGLAQALLPQPEVLLLDEPVSALDPSGRKEVLEILRELRGRMTVFFSTHILNDAERVCDEVAIIDRGKLVLQSNRVALMEHYGQAVFEIDSLPNAQVALSGVAETLRNVAWISAVEQDGSQLRVRVKDVAIAQHQIVNYCAGLPITRIEQVGATLEDVFLKLTHEAV